MVIFEKKRMNHSLFALLLLCCISCNNKKTDPHNGEKNKPQDGGDVAGGPCTYKDYVMSATVIAIKGEDSTRMNVFFVLGDADGMSRVVGKRDTINYYSEKMNYLTPSKIKEMGIVKGAQYKYIESQIVSGSCNPTVRQLVMTKYEATSNSK
jgi:hypothetical protein